MTFSRPVFPEDHYTRIPNAWIRDGNLRPNAKAILFAIMSHDANYKLTVSQVMRETGLGRDAVNAATTHMLELGYLVGIAQTVGERGQFGENHYIVTSCTGVPDPRESPADPHILGRNVRIGPLRSDPVAVSDRSGEIPPVRRTRTEGEDQGTPTESPTAAQLALVPPHDPFDDFWKVYPRKVGKDAARRAWRKAVRRAEADVIVAAAAAYPFDRSRPQFIPHPSTWLNDGRWQDDPAAVAASSGGERARRLSGSNYGPAYRNPDPTDPANRGAFDGGF